jgi:RecA-family ATPase
MIEMMQIVESDQLFLIEGYVSASSTIIFGQPKAGKTVLMTQLVRSLAEGVPFFDVPVSKHRVAVALTDPGAFVDFAKQCADLGMEVENIVCVEDIRDDSDFDTAIKMADVLVVDNLDGLLPPNADMNSRNGVRPTIERLNTAIANNVSVIVVHHANKPGQFGAGRLPNGSQFITAWPRSILHLEKNRKGTGTHKLTVSGNHTADRVFRLAMDCSAGLSFALQGEITDKEEEDHQSRQRTRASKTMNGNLAFARHIVNEYNSVSQNKAAEILAKQYGGTPAKYRKLLSTRAISVERDDSTNMWRLTEAASSRISLDA